MANIIVMPAPRTGEAGRVSLAAMSPTMRARTTGFAGVATCLGLGGVLLGSSPVVGQAPQRVTSDTPEYCGVLMNRITVITHATAVPPPTEVAVLSEEGERMCVHGQTRGGILRLRRALEIMRHGDD